MCGQCDSELPLQPGYNEDDGVHFWCLGYNCNFKRKIGYNTLVEMEKFLEMENVKFPKRNL